MLNIWQAQRGQLTVCHMYQEVIIVVAVRFVQWSLLLKSVPVFIDIIDTEFL
jgi:hypothetical protein